MHRLSYYLSNGSKQVFLVGFYYKFDAFYNNVDDNGVLKKSFNMFL